MCTICAFAAGDSSSAKMKGFDEQLVEFGFSVLAEIYPEPDAKFSQNELIKWLKTAQQ